MDIEIGWQVSGQQDGRLAYTHVYIYGQHNDIPLIQGLSYIYIYICIYSIVYTIIYMVIKKC